MSTMTRATKAQVQQLSDEYERLTGRKGLLYISNPGDGQARYVFGDSDTVKLGVRAARAHIAKLVEDELFARMERDRNTFNYEARQLDRLEPAEFYRLQIRSDTRGETKWLNISPTQLAAIREILTSGSDD